MGKGEGRRGRGGDPRRHQLRGDEVRRERNLHRRVSKKEEIASGPSALPVLSFCPADSCYIRLTHLMGQVVSQGLQFLHNRSSQPPDGESGYATKKIALNRAPLPHPAENGRFKAIEKAKPSSLERSARRTRTAGDPAKRKGRWAARHRRKATCHRFPFAGRHFPFAARSMSATILSTAEHVGHPPSWEPSWQPPPEDPPWQPSHDPPESHNPRPIIRRTASTTSTARISSTTAVEKFISSGAIESPFIYSPGYYHPDPASANGRRRIRIARRTARARRRSPRRRVSSPWRRRRIWAWGGTAGTASRPARQWRPPSRH